MTTNTVATTTTDTSLAKLIPCPAKVRRTKPSSGVEALAVSIQTHGLLQSTVVHRKLDGGRQAADRYIHDGGWHRAGGLFHQVKSAWIAGVSIGTHESSKGASR